MGVRGLLKELERRGLRARRFVATPEAMRALRPAQRHIVVDACSVAGFAYTHLAYGGDFVAAQRKASSFVRQFTAAGFRVTAVVDGAVDAAKTDVWLQRRVTEARHTDSIHTVIDTVNRTHRFARRASDAEAACTPSWKGLLAELFLGARCEVVMSPVEADRDAAALCVLGRGFGVVSHDSDTLVFGVPRVVLPDTIHHTAGRLSFEYFCPEDISRALGIPTSLMPLFVSLSPLSRPAIFTHPPSLPTDSFASLAGNDFAPTCFRQVASHSPSKACPGGTSAATPPYPITVVLEFLIRECAEGRLREGHADEWLRALPFLSDKVKCGIRQSMQQYTIKSQRELILEKSGPFALKTLQLWDTFQRTMHVAPQKLLIQIVADRAVFESPCMELGMPVPVWTITEELRHNLYDLVLAPIRDTAPSVKEVVISPLEACPPRSEAFVPKFSFVDKFAVRVVPGEPIVMFVATLPHTFMHSVRS